MDYSMDSFKPKHKKIVCFDSDGTVIDAMNVKHRRCHGAAFIEEWGLQAHSKEVQAVWDKINLFERSRGVNRFIALQEMLSRMNGLYLSVEADDYEEYCQWVQKDTLTNGALKEQLETSHNPLFAKALHWSEDLNKRIKEVTPQDKPPFKGVRDALETAYGRVDLAIISSSNMAAIKEEWSAHELLSYMSVITSQEVGTKTACLASLIEKGYGRQDILMVGDAYPDVDAALSNGVWYYPILIGHEKESWQVFKDWYLDAFLNGEYGVYQQALLEQYENNFIGA